MYLILATSLEELAGTARVGVDLIYCGTQARRHRPYLPGHQNKGFELQELMSSLHVSTPTAPVFQLRFSGMGSSLASEGDRRSGEAENPFLGDTALVWPVAFGLV